MANKKEEYITLADLYLAYKKAKVEAFRENTFINVVDYSEYEKNLENNLRQLHSILIDNENSWSSNKDIVCGHTYIPKSLNCSCWDSEKELFYRAIDPIEDWKNRFKVSKKKRVDTSFRLISTPTINFQIISALWVIKVGHLYDARIDSSVSYANRLRRIGPISGSHLFEQAINTESRDLFQPYFPAYRKWRDNGLTAMKESLKEGKEILAITMDIRQFYHHVSPKFLIRKSYLSKLDLSLIQQQKQFTEELLRAIDTWYTSTPDYSARPEGALPVGLSASKIISNVLMCEFDYLIKSQLSPIYYGRYVDDIFLVLQKNEEITTGKSFLKWLSLKIGKSIKYVNEENGGPYLQAKFTYAKDCELIFPSDKQKIFDLSPSHGVDLIEHIAEQIRLHSSEYRMLSELPDTNIDMAAKALLATPDASLAADALRKADVVSVKRLGFSLLLGDVENYERDLKPDAWVDVRDEFYELVDRYLLTPTGIFEFTRYLHRVFSLSIACRDFEFSKRFLEKFDEVLELLEKTSTASTSGKRKYEECIKFFYRTFLQVAIQASTVRSFEFSRKFTSIIKVLTSLSNEDIKYTRKNLISLSHDVLLSDLGRRPYKDYWYYEQNVDFDKEEVPSNLSVRKLLRISSIRYFRKIAELHIPYWKALAFPTRPLTLSEIGLIAPKVIEDQFALKRSILGLRGARVISSDPFGVFQTKDEIADRRYIVSIGDDFNKVNVALTNIKTSQYQWESAAKDKPDRSLYRYKRFVRIINQILSEKTHVDYIVFPECSIPRRWAISIANKLSRNRVSFIAGLEYYKHRKLKRLRNDSLISMATNWPGYSTGIIYLQPKLEPAHEEKKELRRLHANPLHIPTGTQSILPIFIHNNLHFGVLICSDLTNISNREYYQGDVDALFVLEWNQDLNTFSSLVESAAHDVNAFILQINNRKYGDSRIRAPYRKDYMRDLVRVKGGISDYYVIGEIDFLELRKSQKRKSNPTSEFKPVPIGFKMSPLRK